MSKVDPLKGGMGALPGVKRKRTRGKGAPAPKPEHTADGIPTHVMPQVEEIVSTGMALTDDPTGEYLEYYRNAVREFLDMALAESMRVDSESSLGLQQKVFSTITRVDVALAELTDAVLGRQQDILRLKDIIDQIKGLIVDLYQ